MMVWFRRQRKRSPLLTHAEFDVRVTSADTEAATHFLSYSC